MPSSSISTRAPIRCLTCNVPGAAFLRVMHLSTGDYLLIGPERFTDIRTSRGRDNELWFLSKKPGSKPVRLGQKMSEGAAVSKKSHAHLVLRNLRPEPGPARGRVALSSWPRSISADATPVLTHKRVVYEQPRNGLHARGTGLLR